MFNKKYCNICGKKDNINNLEYELLPFKSYYHLECLKKVVCNPDDFDLDLQMIAGDISFSRSLRISSQRYKKYKAKEYLKKSKYEFGCEMKDKCVVCGKETEYDKDKHIDLREHYIEGAGQLCEECYKNIYESMRRC